MVNPKDIAKGAGVGSSTVAGAFLVLYFQFIEPKFVSLQSRIDTIESTTESQVENHLMEKLSDKTGGTKTQIAIECERVGKDITPSDVPYEIAMGLVWRDSLQLFDKAMKPMLVKELNTHDIGLKVSKTTNIITYLHTDGNTYFPAYNHEHQRFYIMNQDGTTSWCQ